jgi:hypothetical protein
MQFRAPLLPRDHEICLFQDSQMLRHRLAGHVEAFAHIVQALSVPGAEPIQQPPAAFVRQSAEHGIHAHKRNMQPHGCMSSEQNSRLLARRLEMNLSCAYFSVTR